MYIGIQTSESFFSNLPFPMYVSLLQERGNSESHFHIDVYWARAVSKVKLCGGDLTIPCQQNQNRLAYHWLHQY